MSALGRLQKWFPKVATIKDATKGLTIEVTRKDEQTSKRKQHSECALAVACKRSQHLDGAIIGVTTAYLVKDKEAIRYQLLGSTSREVVSFDRGADFAPGRYRLIKPQHKFGARGGKTKHTGVGPKRLERHITENIRTVLGHQEEIA